jgi:outer membrane protein OmpA-like peptidoglycan-associated protein
MKKLLEITVVLVLVVSMLSCSALDTRQKKGTAGGAAVGAAVGAILGQAIGGDTKSTLWGAAIGTVVGGIAGHEIAAYMDQQEQRLQAAAAQSEAMSVARTQDVLTATFKSDVMFDFDSAILKPGAFAEIDRIAGVLNQFPQTVVRVEGHTDSKGSEVYNQELSERRANAVGESMPISSNDALNRRVNVVIIPVEARG